MHQDQSQIHHPAISSTVCEVLFLPHSLKQIQTTRRHSWSIYKSSFIQAVSNILDLGIYS